MAGPRGFETSDVLDAAVDSFWSAGFDAVSVRDLETATGLKAAGLYNAFGDKRGLFLAALTAYVNTRVRERIARRGRDPAFGASSRRSSGSPSRIRGAAGA